MEDPNDRLEVMEIVYTQGEQYGVVVGRTLAPPYADEYRVQLIEINAGEYSDGERFYSAGFVGLFNRNQVTRQGFCENDSEQALILCAAASVAFSVGNRHAS